jgi:hypothetical protein
MLGSKAKFLAKIGYFLLDFLVAGKSVINVWEGDQFCGSVQLFLFSMNCFGFL